MSDAQRGLHKAAGLRWILITAAVLLTVVAGVLGFFEVANHESSTLRAFMTSVAAVTWIAWIALSCSLLVIRKVTKAINKAKAEILAAVCEKRLSNIAELMEEGGNVRMINDRRR